MEKPGRKCCTCETKNFCKLACDWVICKLGKDGSKCPLECVSNCMLIGESQRSKK